MKYKLLTFLCVCLILGTILGLLGRSWLREQRREQALTEINARMQCLVTFGKTSSSIEFLQDRHYPPHSACYVRGGTPMTNEDLDDLKYISGLQIFTLNGNLSGRKLASIDLSRAKDLHFDNVTISDGDWSFLQKLGCVNTLSFSSIRPFPTEEILALVSCNRDLKSLQLVDIPLGEKGTELMTKLRSLEHLELTRTNSTEEALIEIAKLPNLQSLSIEDQAITDTAFSHLANTQINKLKIWSSSQLTQKTLETLSTLPLRELEILRCPGFSSNAIARLQPWPELHSLKTDIEFTDEQIQWLIKHQNLKSLSLLYPRISQEGVETIIDKLPQLKRVEILSMTIDVDWLSWKLKEFEPYYPGGI